MKARSSLQHVYPQKCLVSILKNLDGSLRNPVECMEILVSPQNQQRPNTQIRLVLASNTGCDSVNLAIRGDIPATDASAEQVYTNQFNHLLLKEHLL
jgi:hypothetical protein